MDQLIDPLDAALRDAAATEILPRFRALDASDIASKSRADDLVTIADKAAEVVIAEKVAAIMPAARFIGEEAVAADPDIRNGVEDAETAVIVDPIDGTWCYANGIPTFGSMLAVTRGGETVLGLIHLPTVGDTIVAERGAGVRLRRADRSETPLPGPRAAPLDQAQGYIGYTGYAPAVRARLIRASAGMMRVAQLMCSAWEYGLLAEGRGSFALQAGIEPWDHAAGALMIEEAGGVSAVILADGSTQRYRPALRSGRLLCAPDAEMWRALADAFGPLEDD